MFLQRDEELQSEDCEDLNSCEEIKDCEEVKICGPSAKAMKNSGKEALAKRSRIAKRSTMAMW